MISGFVVFAIATAVAVYVVAPLLKPDAAEAERMAAKLSEEQDLESQREMALAALRDLEEDRATGKIGDADYDDLKARLSNRAVEIMKRLDEIGTLGPRPLPEPPPEPGS